MPTNWLTFHIRSVYIPRPELFNALMPYDKYEVEYEFVDTNNGIRAKSEY